MKYFLPLDSNLTEHIFAPFHDPEHSHWIPVQIDTTAGLEVTRNTLWDSTSFSWPSVEGRARFSLLMIAPFSTDANDEIIICLSLPKEARFQAALINKERQVCSSWSDARQGDGTRQEVVLTVSKMRRLRGLLRSKVEFEGLILRVVSAKTDVGILALSWIGMRNSVSYAQTLKSRARYRLDWSPWVLPYDAWGEVHFERGLLFDEMALKDVRDKMNQDGWREHFSLLESRAMEYLKRNPEDDFCTYLPNHDNRYIRDSEHGKTAYHWEALVLAFVGLVKKDRTLIEHALRYLMCMVHTRSWTESADHDIPSSTWTHLCFMEEMTTTSVALLLDWLGFALFDRTKILIRKVLWERGITPIMRDLFSNSAIHQMNQGAVFCRGVVLGGLMLEAGWPKFQKQIVDDAYETMCQVLDGYIKPDGGVHEGVGYLCQTLTATQWTMIAYGRARDLEWKDGLKKRFINVGRYAAVMSASSPGKVIPSGDCRVEWFGGDAIPILASIFPGSPFEHMLHNCLVEGWVHELTGTLSKSGGMIGMVYGPSEVFPSKTVIPTYDYLPESNKVTLLLGGDMTPSVRLWVSGSALGGTHSHADHGQFCLEINGAPVFIDRGMVQYWFSEAHFLSCSWLHNVLTPVDANGCYPNQSIASEFNEIEVSEDQKNIRVLGNGVWENWIENYERLFFVKDASFISVEDQFTLIKSGCVAFHLHSPFPFQIDRNQAILKMDGFSLHICFDWAITVECSEVLIDLKKNPVFHLVAISKVMNGTCRLNTSMTIKSL